MTDSAAWLQATLQDFPNLGISLYVRSGTARAEAEGPVLTRVGNSFYVVETARAEAENPALTEEEASGAIAFGRLLKGYLGDVICAPGNTSRETAYRILEAAGVSSAALQIDPDIGDPSVYVIDEPLMKEDLNTASQGLHDVARLFLLEGILYHRADWAAEDPKKAARAIHRKIVSAMSPGKVSVFVAPSVAIAATVALSIGVPITLADCPAYLEGAVVFRAENGDGWYRMGSYEGRTVL